MNSIGNQVSNVDENVSKLESKDGVVIDDIGKENVLLNSNIDEGNECKLKRSREGVDSVESVGMGRKPKKRSPRSVNTCIGQCASSETYSHDYLHCTKCNLISRQCDILYCPCNGSGFLFATDSEYVFSHQMPQHKRSIRVSLNRRKQAIERIKNLMKGDNKDDKAMAHQQNYNSATGVSQQYQEAQSLVDFQNQLFHMYMLQQHFVPRIQGSFINQYYNMTKNNNM